MKALGMSRDPADWGWQSLMDTAVMDHLQQQLGGVQVIHTVSDLQNITRLWRKDVLGQR